MEAEWTVMVTNVKFKDLALYLLNLPSKSTSSSNDYYCTLCATTTEKHKMKINLSLAYNMTITTK